ncbi:4'-phosphopantetheinyl transferase family protein [Undibacterium sp. RuRC25W]|uniref:4'-phosphopantetheinyl transferase family protein n=1 Tax=Undibacterium sp. RuRC25W TaxID=3413047 RepID=UPI003BF33C52
MSNYFSVLIWPLQAQVALEKFASGKIIVIATLTPENMARDAARQHLRLALSEFLAAAFHSPAEQLRITSVIAEGVKVSIGDVDVHISTSHESGISVAAISGLGRIGVDIMRIDLPVDWQDVARLYFGERRTTTLIATAKPHQAPVFAQYWTQLEATLKCAGCALTEYETQITPEFSDKLKDIHVYPLDVTNGYTASLALQGKKHPPH